MIEGQKCHNPVASLVSAAVPAHIPTFATLHHEEVRYNISVRQHDTFGESSCAAAIYQEGRILFGVLHSRALLLVVLRGQP